MITSIEEQQQAFIAFMSRHLVALAIDYQSFDRGKLHATGATYYSGFIVELHDEWYWVTAGHCLKDLDKLIKDGTMKVLHSTFMDSFGWGARHTEPIPYAYEVESGIYIYDRTKGIDFGLLPLNGLLRAAFKANGIIPVSRCHWVHQPTLNFSVYKVLGFPSSEVRIEQRPDGLISGCRAHMFDVEKLDPATVPEVPSDVFFVAKMNAESTIESIEGMSGGPIFGFRKNEQGEWAYHIVALQSSWIPPKRIIMGCSLPLFAEYLHQVIAKMKQ